MPFKPHERLYRSFAASNFQPVERDDKTEEQEPSYKVRGYYTVWDSEYELYPRTKFFPAEYEQVDRHALDGADLSDVIFQENHEGSPLARIRNGSLQLGTDEHGAWCIADLGGCQRGREIYESIKNGLIAEMSFGFIVDNSDESDGYTTFKDEDGDYHTTITRIRKVFDCSCVSIPASPYTEISELRSLSVAMDKIEADRKAVEEHKAEDVTEETEERDVDVDAIVERVLERVSQKPWEKDDDPDEPDDADDKDEPDDDEDDKEDRSAKEAEERAKVSRRKRRMRAIQLIDI